MSNLKEARKMLLVAKRDLKALQGMKDDPQSFANEIFGFHTQQAVEKAIKALLSLTRDSYPKIHDLEELFNLLQDDGYNIPEHFLSLINFTDFASDFRYDVVPELDEDLPREIIITQVTEFMNYVGSFIRNYESNV